MQHACHIYETDMVHIWFDILKIQEIINSLVCDKRVFNIYAHVCVAFMIQTWPGAER